MTNESPVRVLIADDHLLFAESLGLTLDIDDRLEHIGTARNGKEAVRMVVTGFFQQVFDRITIDSVREALGEAIGRRIREYD